MQDHETQIGECTYKLRAANFIEAKIEAFKLTTLLKGCFSASESVNFDIGQLLVNINSPAMADVEKFILKHAVVVDEHNKTFLLQKSDEANTFFNTHRDHYFSFIFEGLKFHFLGFLPNGLASKVSTLDLGKLVDSAM
ncbi:tail assembly chaperone [Orbus hercynius]|uniref:Tail assembly chaperone n=1 Tax=Orbus hercynius TaxID=593135 RepID=A0A495RHA8_9GAMM|nr:putative phage tail assembly chaperone [Orbus hercynius]RKS86913.1 tail assembly chaperone [Orbus hercynius]